MFFCVFGASAGAPEVSWLWTAHRDWGFVASGFDDADGAERVRAAGPFWEEAESAGGRKLLALPRPLWSRAVDPVAGRNSWDFLWPVASGKTFGAEKSWRAGVAWFLDDDREDAESRYRFWLLPFWFHGRDADGKNYAALFPLGGEIRNFLLQDRIRFALWPLWTQSQINEVRTTSVLWPIYSRTTTPDDHLTGLRVFPLFSHSKSVRQWEKTTVLWPLWTHANYFHPKAAGSAWVFWPVVGRVNLNSQQGWMFLPPFFQFIRGEQMNRIYCPWPIFQRETDGRAKEKLYLWPLYGFRKDGPLERYFWIWPLSSREQNDFGARHRTRWMLTPLWTCVTETPTNAPEQVLARRSKLWPLFSSQWDASEKTAPWRCLDLWPAGRPPAVERSWAPLWTLVDIRSNGENRDVEVLWGAYRDTKRGADKRSFSVFPLWRHERVAGDQPEASARRWSVLKGLIAYDRTATNRQVRLLWLGRIRLAPPSAEKVDESL